VRRWSSQSQIIGANLPRMRSALSDHVLVELPNAAHFIQEDEPDRIAEAIIERFD
jgi:haloalkane dehalogenase